MTKRSSNLEFEEVMRPHLAGIYGRAYALTGNVQDAEDLVQEVCIRAARGSLSSHVTRTHALGSCGSSIDCS